MEFGISAVGMATALGLDTDACVAAVRAGISGVVLQRHLSLSGPDPEWDPREPLRAGRVPSLDPHGSGFERLLSLATTALSDATRRAGSTRAELADAALFVALPREDAATGAWGVEQFTRALLDRAALPPPRAAEMFRSGHTGALFALRRAMDGLAQRAFASAVIVAADTLVTADRVEALDAARRLRSKRARDGYVPGEAAVAWIVGPLGEASLARIEGFGVGHEPDGYGADRAPMGHGLESAVRAAAPGGGAIEWLLSDMNGESFRAMEFSATRARLGATLGASMVLTHPTELTGDLGAAAGAFLVGCAATSLGDGTAPAERAIVVASDDDGGRVAVGLSAGPGAQS